MSRRSSSEKREKQSHQHEEGKDGTRRHLPSRKSTTELLDQKIEETIEKGLREAASALPEDDESLMHELDEISKEADAEQKSETEKENRLLKLRDRVRKKAGANLTAHVKDGRSVIEDAVTALKNAGQKEVVSSLLTWYLDLWEKAINLEKVDLTQKANRGTKS